MRKRLIALYAVNYEIARTAETVREAGLGDIRLEWWRGGLEEIAQGGQVRAHPVLQVLSGALADPQHALALQKMVEARGADFETAPFAAWADLEAYVDATAGALMAVSLAQCAVSRPTPAAFAEAAGRAWGYAGLLRAAPFNRARGRSVLPREGGDESELRARARSNYEQARELAQSLPQETFPAFGYIALVPRYLRAPEREHALIGRQLSLIAASATGRL